MSRKVGVEQVEQAEIVDPFDVDLHTVRNAMLADKIDNRCRLNFDRPQLAAQLAAVLSIAQEDRPPAVVRRVDVQGNPPAARYSLLD